MNPIPGIDNKYAVPTLIVGTLSVSLALGSLLFLPDPQPRDYVILSAEVGIGVAIAIIVYGISRKNETELTEIARNTNAMIRRQEILNRDIAQSAEQHLQKTLYQIQKSVDEVLKSKQAYDSANKSEKKIYKNTTESRCQNLEYYTKAITTALPSFYWMDNLGRLTTLHRLCVQNSRNIDKMDVRAYEIVKAEAQKMLEEIRNRSELSESSDEQSPDGIGQQSLSVSASSTTYPLHSVIYVRAKIERLLDGNKIRYEILDQRGEVIERKDLDPKDRQYADLTKFGIFEVSFKMRGVKWKVGDAYAVRATYGSLSAEDAFSITHNAPVVQSDKDAYVVGSDMIITVIDPDANVDGNAVDHAGDRRYSKLVVESPRDKIDGYRLLEDGADTGIFQGSVRIIEVPEGGSAAGSVGPPVFQRQLAQQLLGAFSRLGRARPNHRKGPDGGVLECGRGDEITIKYTNRINTAVRTVRTARFGATVEMDQMVYTCTDRVYMTVVAPDLDAGLPPAGSAASEKYCQVSVKTSMGRLAAYRLVECERDSGIFVGSVSLTGFPDMARKVHTDRPLGVTQGEGPDDGMLACMSEDSVEVTVSQGGKSYRGSALTRWNVGVAQFLKSAYAVGDLAVIRIVDPDMNLDSEAIDSFRIRVRSDSDREGIEIAVTETAIASGIFDGEFELDFERSSQKNAVLLVSYGDTVHAEYVDATLPPPSNLGDEQRVASTTLISADRTVQSPLTRLKIESIDVQSGETGLSTLIPGEPALVKVKVGGAKKPHTFTVLLQIEDSEGASHGLLHQSAHIEPDKTSDCAFSWTPPKSGKFVFEVFLWKSIEDPTAFSPTKKKNVTVV